MERHIAAGFSTFGSCGFVGRRIDGAAGRS
jgi:hypothetical protein